MRYLWDIYEISVRTCPSIYAVYNAMLFVKFTLDPYLYKGTNCSGVLKQNDAYAFPPHPFILFFSKIIWCLTTNKENHVASQCNSSMIPEHTVCTLWTLKNLFLVYIRRLTSFIHNCLSVRWKYTLVSGTVAHCWQTVHKERQNGVPWAMQHGPLIIWQDWDTEVIH